MEGERQTILFDSFKREIATLGSGFQILARKLRGDFDVAQNKEDIESALLDKPALVVFGGPRDKFSKGEFDSMKNYLAGGGSILVLLGEGGETRLRTNINYFLEEYGIMVNSDAVLRTVFYRYFHPKEVYVSDGILNRELNRAAGKAIPGQPGASGDAASLTFVYPYGATLNVQKPAIPVLSSGYTTYPLNRPIGAYYEAPASKGRLAVIGSTNLFSDEYLMKEENHLLQEIFFKWLLHDQQVVLNKIDAEEPEISDYHHLPDTAAQAEKLRSCLQEGEEPKRDLAALADDEVFSFSMSVVPEAIGLYEQLNLKHEPLSLIPPQFERPLPSLQPAVFQPIVNEAAAPGLELFDLDEHFASEVVRLAQLANKCQNKDLDYFISEAGQILGVTAQLKEADHRTPKDILHYVMQRLVKFKKFNAAEGGAGQGPTFGAGVESEGPPADVNN